MAGWLKNAFYTETVSVQHTPLDFLKQEKVLFPVPGPQLILFQHVSCILIPILCRTFSATQDNQKKYASIMHLC